MEQKFKVGDRVKITNYNCWAPAFVDAAKNVPAIVIDDHDGIYTIKFVHKIIWRDERNPRATTICTWDMIKHINCGEQSQTYED